MSIMKRFLEAIKVKLSDSKSMKEYIGTYWKAYYDVDNITTKESEMITKIASMLLQRVLLSKVRLKYTNIISTIKSE